MKKFLLLLSMLPSVVSFGQDSLYKNIQEPEFPFEPVFVNNDLSSVGLQKELAAITYRSKPAWQKGEFVISNAHSTFLVKSSTVTLAVKHDLIFGTQTNPRDTYKLYKLEVDEKKKKRIGLFSENKNDMNGHVKFINDTLNIPMTFKKVRDNIYITKVENLVPGDYGWFGGASNVYTFKIE